LSLLGPRGKRQLLRQQPALEGLLDGKQVKQGTVPEPAEDAESSQAGSLFPSPQVDKSPKEQGDKGISPLGDKSPSRREPAVGGRETAAETDVLPAHVETSVADLQVDTRTKLQDGKAVQPLNAKRTDYTKKGYYLGLRHQEILDDLARELRRRGLPDDRSMIIRALLDAAHQRLQEDGGAWIDQLAAFCLATLPGTTKNGGTRG